MKVKMAMYPRHDSDNSDPAEVNLSQDHDGNVVLETSNPSRRLVFSKGDWKVANQIIFPSGLK
jgi:hypothetical protein